VGAGLGGAAQALYLRVGKRGGLARGGV